MPSKKSSKDKSMASDLKKRGMERRTSSCPWGCGHSIAIGGGALIAHLGQCKGGGTKRKAAK